MAYTSGDLILDDHYNDFASDVNDVWGTGTGDYGYGQSSVLSTVSPGATVTATQWSTLLSRISNSASHQGSSITSISSPSTGDTISAYAALSSNITTIRTNRLNAAANTGASTPDTASNTTDWTNELSCTCTWTWPGGDEIRYFFNAGGYIEMYVDHGSGGNSKDQDWDSLCSTAGVYRLYASTGESTWSAGATPTTNLTSTGYYDLSTSYTTMFQKPSSSGTYSSNFLQYRFLVNAAHGDGRGNNGNTITGQIRLVDAGADDFNDTVENTTTFYFRYNAPSTTYLTNVWGNPTVTPGIPSVS